MSKKAKRRRSVAAPPVLESPGPASEAKSSDAAPPPPPCGLTQEKIERYHDNGMCKVVEGLCQNRYRSAAGEFVKCGQPLGSHPSERAAPGTSTTAPDWEKISLGVVTFTNGMCSGQGAIVSPHFVLSALHGSYEVGTKFRVSLKNETVTKRVYLAHEWFVEGKSDIALLKLEDREAPFSNALDVLNRDVCVQEKISVLALQQGLGGTLDFSSQMSSIYMMDSGTALCRAQYYAEDGSSGSAVITEVESDGNVKVIGVHVLSQDATIQAGPIERVSGTSKAADFESVSSHSDQMARNIHGHIAYCMFCVAFKFPDLLTIIRNDKIHVDA